MFFVDVLDDAAGCADNSTAALGARLRFHGERTGEFRIAVAPETARTITANFLGLDDEQGISDSQIADVACELANMICGSLLSRFAGNLTFELSRPEPELGLADGSEWTEATTRTFDLGNGWLTAAIRFNDDAAKR
jgi:hypothetical protein